MASTQSRTSPDLVRGDDGVLRCPWAGPSLDYRRYHDTEWGVPIRADRELYERLCLESFQSGLSWLTILRKREAFREAFVGFDPVAVSEFDESDVLRLLADARIVRHRGKIMAAITNARALVALWAAEGEGVLAPRLERAAHPRRPASPRPAVLAQIPAATAGSTALARELRSLGFTFLGPTTVYSAMQATGFVDDHLRGCQGATIPLHQG